MRSPAFVSRSVTAPGGAGDLVAISLPYGEARGIIVDNPSGSWVSVSPFADLIPPYTMQWSRSFPYGVASTNVRYVAGPAGQQSSIEGTPFTVWLDSDPVAGSGGISVPGNTFKPLAIPTLDVIDFLTTLGLAQVLVAADLGSIMRLYSFRIGVNQDTGSAIQDMPFNWVIQRDPLIVPTSENRFAFGTVSPASGYVDGVDFTTNPRDIPLTTDVALVVDPFWDDVYGVSQGIEYHLRYAIL